MQLDITVTDQVIDLLDERADVAIRVGPMRPSQLRARKLGESRMALVASPAYLARRGAPEDPAELNRHSLITFNFARHSDEWPFIVNGGRLSRPAHGDVMVGDGESSRRLVLAGQGIARLSHFHIGRDIAEGRLIPVLEAFNPDDTEAVNVIYCGQSRHVPARVRGFIDFLAETVDLERPPAEGR